MMPVIVLSDGYLANGAEPWRIPDARGAAGDPRALPHRARRASGPTSATRTRSRGRGRCPGTPGLEHRIGGLEKQDVTGNVSYDPLNHETMVRLRAAKVEAIAAGRAGRGAGRRPGRRAADRRLGLDLRRDHRRAARRSAPRAGAIGHVHLRHLNPLPKNLGDVLERYRRVLVPELNMGQLALAAAREVPGGRDLVPEGAGQAVQAVRARGEDRRDPRGEEGHEWLRQLPVVHEEGLPERPGGPLVPRLRGLRDPLGRAVGASPSSASRGRSSSWSRASAARAASRTT